MILRTKEEQKAYIDGYEMCANCIEEYLTDEGKKKLQCLLIAVRNTMDKIIAKQVISAIEAVLKKKDGTVDEKIWFIRNIINTYDKYYQAESEKDGITFNNLCNSCTNIGCIFQSGIVRTKCAFYMPPHIEADKAESEEV